MAQAPFSPYKYPIIRRCRGDERTKKMTKMKERWQEQTNKKKQRGTRKKKRKHRREQKKKTKKKRRKVTSLSLSPLAITPP
jgi:hypothetical protein